MRAPESEAAAQADAAIFQFLTDQPDLQSVEIKGGAPLGWLSWFLAPMQDGKFMVDGAPFEIAKAVYVFAGGRARLRQQAPLAHRRSRSE